MIWNIAKMAKEITKRGKVPVTDIKKNCRADADRPIEEIDSKVAIALGKRVAEIIVE
jgi:hypothetical protein